MTDVFTDLLQFAFWSFAYFSVHFAWTHPVRLAIFITFCALMLCDLRSPIQFEIPSSIGHPLNVCLRLATLAITILFLWRAMKEGDREAR